MKNYDKITTNKYGTILYTLKDKYHRLDGPAAIYINGNQAWYQNGLLHREDGPAVIYSNGDQLYYKFGIYLNSPNDNPIFLTKDSKYSLYYLNGKFIAGCRKFTKQEAI